jgi:hypothetical protein
MVFRAFAGFALVFGLLHGEALRADLSAPAVRTIRADLAAVRPGATLLASFDAVLRGFSSRNGTDALKPSL